MPRQVHTNPQRSIHNHMPTQARFERTTTPQKLYDAQIAKEKAIGTDPLFKNGPRSKREALSKAWRVQERAYDAIQRAKEAEELAKEAA